MLGKNSKIFIAGHKGMVGSAILRKFKSKNYKNVIVVEKRKLNLLNQKKVYDFLKKKKPDCVIIAAARVGGILANANNKAKFIFENLQIQNNLIHGSFLAGVKNLIFLGSSCIYPKHSKQPIKEKYILTGPLEETNDAYAIAKIAGVLMCNNYKKKYKVNFKCFMPSNMYGPNDSYNINNSHFFAALIRKIYRAKIFKKKKIEVWGTGTVYRELLFVDDFADSVFFFLNKNFKEPFINIGSGRDHTIKWYTKFIMKQLRVNLSIKFDKSKPDGMKKKLLDSSIANNYGWKSKTSLERGFKITFNDFIKKNN